MKEWKVSFEDISDFHGGRNPMGYKYCEYICADSRIDAIEKVKKSHTYYMSPKFKKFKAAPIPEKDKSLRKYIKFAKRNVCQGKY